jgi:hypothetical protein
MWLEAHLASTGADVKDSVRRHPRVLFSVPISLRHLIAGGVQTTRGLSLDLSESGVGALVERALHVGDTVMIDLELPGGKLDIAAIVRHTSSVRSGFEFLGLTTEDRCLLTQAVGHC